MTSEGQRHRREASGEEGAAIFDAAPTSLSSHGDGRRCFVIEAGWLCQSRRPAREDAFFFFSSLNNAQHI